MSYWEKKTKTLQRHWLYLHGKQSVTEALKYLWAIKGTATVVYYIAYYIVVFCIVFSFIVLPCVVFI